MTNGQRSLGAGTFLVVPAFAVWALVAMGIVVRPPALQTARPEAAMFPERPAVGEERVPARLWQDPLQAAYAAHDQLQAEKDRTLSTVTEKKAADQSSIPAVQAWARAATPLTHKQMRENMWAHTAPGNLIWVLPVFLPGGTYSDDVETRIRIRYAALAGLSVAGYVPEDRNHIGYFTMDYRSDSDAGNKARPPRKLVIPFEWYKWEPSARSGAQDAEGDAANTQRAASTQGAARPQATTGSRPPVLVLWIDESYLGEKPLTVLAAILGGKKGLYLGSSCQAENTETSFEAKILGPTNSNVLLDMLREGWKAAALPPELKSLSARFYSARATISNERLRQEFQVPAGSVDLVKDRLKKLKIERTIADDGEVCRELVKELKRRHVDSSRPQARIVLIAEWDTAYGRALPRTFAEVQGQELKNDRYLLYSYLQGIDGQLPGEQPEARRDVAQKVEAMERPEGRAQLDYIRRLEHQLRRLDKNPREKNGARIRAIGVLGSDVYDKLLILRALRPRFPGVIFFTTDLDARLLHADERKWTRNLLVASAYGLRLCRDLQEPIPPFRDSYQTSIFFATLKLLGEDKGFKKPLPRVYEIGRTRAYDLSVDDEKAASPHPRSPRSQPWLALTHPWLVGIMTVAALVLLLLVARSVRRFVRWVLQCVGERRIAPLAYPLIPLVALGAVTALIWIDHRRADGEPFAFSEGISVWPTELIRLLAVLLSCCCCYRVWVGFGRDTDDIEIVLSDSQTEQPERGRFSRDMLRSLLDIFAYRRNRWRNVGELWKEYHRRRGVASRVARTLLFVVVYAATAGCLFALLGSPGFPGRGSVSLIVDRVVITLSVLSMIVLVFLVLQRTQLCDWLLRQMCEHEASSWPVDARAEWVRRRGLPELRPNADMDGWLSVRLIATHTDTVGRFIYYPFMVLFIMIVSRHPVFDAWAWPTALIVVTSFVFVVVLYASVLLRGSAQRARRSALARLRETLTVVRELRQFRRAETIQRFVADIEAERGGAFSPPFNNPILHAFLIPSGGLGTLVMLEYLLDYL